MQSRGRWLKGLRDKWPFALLFLLLHVVGAGLFWDAIGGPAAPLLRAISVRDAEAVYLGDLPAPVEPSLIDPLIGVFQPPRHRLMTIRHIPAVRPGEPMPHPFVGDCTNCHLLIGGAPAGSQPKTPVGAVLEDISLNVAKVGPPLLPTSNRPHPPAGRCIKCHDIVVKVPVENKGGWSWIN